MHDSKLKRRGRLALAIACVSLNQKQCRSVQHGQLMTEHAKRILDAAMQYEINPECYSREIAIAVLLEVARIPGDPESWYAVPKNTILEVARELQAAA